MIDDIDIIEDEIEDAPAMYPLAAPEIATLTRCEAVIARGVQTFIEVGEALAEIRDGKLYRADFTTFEHYCRNKWGIGDSRARQLIGAAHVAREIETVTNVTLSNEGQARAVAKAPPADRPDVLVRAVAIAGDQPLTAKHITQAAAEIAAPAPDLPDILKRLDAHGYAKTTTREKGGATFHSFRDYSGRSDETGGEIELAEGELPLWLAELDTSAAYAQAKQEKYLEAQARAARLGYDLKRDGTYFTLAISGQAQPTMRGTLDAQIRAIEGYERSAAKQAAALPSEDEQHRITIEAILKAAADKGERTGTALYQQAYDHAREIHDLALHNKMIALIDRATDALPTDAVTPFATPTPPDPSVSDSAAYAQQEARDAGRLERARNLITTGEYDAARVVLSGIEVATWHRDQQLASIPIPGSRPITLAFTADECAALLKEAKAFEQSGLTKKLPTIGQALILLVQGIKAT